MGGGWRLRGIAVLGEEVGVASGTVLDFGQEDLDPWSSVKLDVGKDRHGEDLALGGVLHEAAGLHVVWFQEHELGEPDVGVGADVDGLLSSGRFWLFVRPVAFQF